MEKYILILLTILVALVIAIVYFGYRQLGHLKVVVGKNSANINAIQSLLSKTSYDKYTTNDSNRNIIDSESEDDYSDDISSIDNVNVSDTEFSDSYEDNENVEKELEQDVEQVIEQDIEQNIEQESEKDSEQNIEQVIEQDIEQNIEQESEKDSEQELEKDSEQNIEQNIEQDLEKDLEQDLHITTEEKYEIVEENGLDFMDSIDKDTKVIEVQQKKSRQKSTPNDAPKKYEIGHKQVSENDGQTYEVIANVNGIKRWKKINN
jgi:hypothetical protein